MTGYIVAAVFGAAFGICPPLAAVIAAIIFGIAQISEGQFPFFGTYIIVVNFLFYSLGKKMQKSR